MKHHVSRRDFGLGAVAAGAVLATGGSATRVRAAAPLRIGSLLPRSGFEALIGQGCQRSIEVAKKLLPEMGYSFEVIDADTESKPDVARTQAEKLIREGANILVGAFDSGQTFAIAQVAEQNGVPFVINIGSDPAITEQGYKFVFRNFPTSIMLGTNGLSRFNDLFKATGTTPKTAVLMHVNDTFGQSMLKGINALMPKLNLPFHIVETIAYDPQAKDLSIEVAKAKAAKADIHMVVTRLNDAILMTREMVKQKYEPMAVISPGSPGMYQTQFLKVLGKYAEYAITNVPWLDPRQPLAHTFEAAFTKANPGEVCDIDAGFTFEGILICADAYKRAQSAKPEALVEALKATSIKDRVMLGGTIAFNEKGQNVNLPSAGVQNRNGKPTVVLPAENAELKPVFPVPPWSQRS
ncbi:MAG TPA: ABC transporter substrate-binding protein [Stellaceae bacterium]|nr:ABC transporter substrate-binding protein [Stellaceae bacterium]